jgi:hypothetical protein
MVVPGANAGTTGYVMGHRISVGAIAQELMELLACLVAAVHKQCRRRTCEW